MAKKKSKKKAVKKQTKKPVQVTLDPFGGGTIDRTEPPKVVPYPEAGKKVTDFEQKLDEQLHDEPISAKRGRGRPRKDTIPEPEFAMSEDIIRQTMEMPFDLWAVSQKLDELKLVDKEAAALAAPVKQLLDYYLPNFPTIGIAWLSLAVTSYSIMVTRLNLLAKIRKEKEQTLSSGPVNVKDVGHGGPRSPDLSKTKFPEATEPVKL